MKVFELLAILQGVDPQLTVRVTPEDDYVKDVTTAEVVLVADIELDRHYSQDELLKLSQREDENERIPVRREFVIEYDWGW